MKRTITGVFLSLVTTLAPVAFEGDALAAGRENEPYPHGRFRGECATCHGPEAWKPARFSPKFDHAEFGFPLEGAHDDLSCRSCHGTLDFTDEDHSCVDCHQDVHDGEFGSDCARCHSPRGFHDRSFFARAHEMTRFPLTGAHATADCGACHAGTALEQPTYVHTPTECAACHRDDYDAVSVPNHALAGFPLECATCHNTAAWAGAEFDHSFFPLTGGHAEPSCAACHGDAPYETASSDCYSCHRPDYDAAEDPRHAPGFPTDCASCHVIDRWEGAEFDHTDFPLEKGHGNVECLDCHEGGVYQETSSECYACHQDDFEGTTSPEHVSAGFPQDCTTCHDMDAWPGAAFDHSFFPLENGHAGPSCSSCHGDGVYEGTSSDCYACHRIDYEGTTDPPHAAGYPTDCTGCHGTVAWEGALFEHDAFALTGGHAGATCGSCHGDGVFAGTSHDCASCHRDDFAATANPPHADAGFGDDCASCHNTAGWSMGVAFEHDFFPLTGVHAGLACVTCHTGGPFENASSDCYSCHQADYEGVRSPNHVAGGFSHDCTECHDPGGWPGAVLDHSFFPLTAGHAGISCATCHSDGVYAGRPTDCLSCHQADYDGATEPNHADAGFPTDCAMCHGITTWSDGDFDHDFFSLTGGHADAPCAACHEGAVFAGTPSACVECHQADYEATDDPHHALAGIGTDCAGCHDIGGWPGASFEHAFFALSGGHDGLACASCHSDGVYAGKANDCASCHIDDYQATTDPDHADLGFPTECAGCHDIAAWEGAEFDHSFFALTGGHGGLDCSSCHGGGVFAGTPTECVECHQADYEATDDPHHALAGIGTDCAGCHDIGGWPGASFEHAFFALAGGHDGLACASCHSDGVYAGKANDCASCHMDDYQATTDPDHADLGFPTECAGCHDIAAWEGAEFDHSFFALTGGHDGLDCSSCHGGGVFAGTPAECAECHQADYAATTNPHHALAGIGTDCAGCHDIGGWPGASFEHAFFALAGGHGGLECAACHADGVYAGKASDCASCHMDDYQATTEPNHVAGGFPTECASCHDIDGWEGAEVDHSFFPLTGGHAGAPCAACHVGGVFSGLPSDCYSCHQADYEGTTNPDHQAADFSTDCLHCHEITGWAGATIDHSFFSLAGGHDGLECTACHVNGVYAGTSSDCYSCHQDDYESAADPNHGDAGFPIQCGQCHGLGGWEGGTFNHSFFALSGGHSGLGCNACHGDGVFEGKPSDCYACHQADYDGTTDPNHVTAGFPTECASCHDIDGWDGATFDHAFFPLSGGHGDLACASCHGDGVYAGKPSDCYSCHQSDFESTTDPNHVTAGFPTECASCHDIDGWDGATFDHAFFPLSGGHGGLECASCHAGGVFEGTPSDCYACHQAEFEGTTDPNHVAAAFPTDCASCHNISGWAGAGFDHSFFVLAGGHSGLTCNACHGDDVYAGKPSDCASCHMDDYQSTTDPNHVTAGFPTDCAQCHDLNGWDGATFDHSFFPLSGGHGDLTCASCHAGGVFEGTPSDCYACHQADFQSTTDPDHVDAGFSTDCTQCHDIGGWNGASFDHSFFALAGGHSGLTCNSCHGDGVYAGKPSDCYSCHQSDFQSTTDPNHVTAGFPTDCTQCHDINGWDGADFDHSFFALTGGHGGLECASCHGDGVFEGKPSDCVECHLADYQSTTDPNHSDAAFPTDCAACHDIDGWPGATFDHSFFALTGGHSALTCNSCHGDGVYVGRTNDCYACHQADFQATTDPNHVTAGFPTDCTQCHDINGWDGADFDHSFFPLSGGHGGLSCASCHSDGVFAGTPSDCYACHQSDFQSTTNPNHVDAGFSTDCTQCHTLGGWAGASFDHSFFALTGGHSGLTCNSCHGDGVYAGKPNDCYSCHQSDFQSTTDPNHVDAGFPTDCAQCHSISGWEGASFNHSFFPLSGGHSGLTCNSCHGDGVYAGKPNDCYACHQADYQSTTDPNHVTAGFPTDCAQCHDISGWEGASFNHSFFPLSGGHGGLTCNDCHSGGVYEGTSSDCYACHQADYQSTTDPNHVTAGFPTDCAQCHTINGWGGATFDHDGDYFPIYSGRHRDKWDTCSDCHYQQSDYGVFSCLGCHPHNDRNGTDNDHNGVNGYSYDSYACYGCHPDGRE